MNDDLFCQRCGEKLNPKKAVWLDLNTDTGRFRAEPWPVAISQGAFAFGSACAKVVLKADGICRSK